MQENNMNFQYGQQNLKSYYKQGKISEEEYNYLRDSITLLFNTNSKSIENYTRLKQTLQQLRKQVTTYKEDLNRQEALNNSDSEKAEELSRQLKSAQTVFESVKTSLENRKYELQEIEKDNKVMQDKHRQSIRLVHDDQQPKKAALQQRIEQTQKQHMQLLAGNENKMKSLEEKNQRISQFMKMIEQAKQVNAKKQEQNNNNKDLPGLSQASNKNLEEQINKLEKEKRLAEQDTVKKQQTLELNRTRKKQIEQKRDFEKAQVQRLNAQINLAVQAIKQITQEKGRIDLQILELRDKRTKNVQETVALGRQISDFTDRKITNQKAAEDLKRQAKAKKKRIQQLMQEINEKEKQQEKIRKQTQQILDENQRLDIQIRKLIDETTVTIKNRQKKVKSTTQKATECSALKASVQEQQLKLAQLKKANQDHIKNVNQLTALRQTMARKASSANNQVRQTAQQVKIKQLQILDLTKKYQQTEAKLDDYKSMYEQVKTGRNKYVNLIQNSSQELAQLKERIKNLDNQLQILTNESAEKVRTLQQYSRTQKKETHIRDQIKKQLNKREAKLKEKDELIDQNINQVQKQNMIISSLEKDIESLKIKHELVCVSKNSMGIKLIDRNDDLCVLYEKSNIQEYHLREAEVKVKTLEDSIRMIKIEIAGVDRKIQNQRNKVREVPKLAERVVQLNSELKIEQEKEEQLCKKLQDPNNKSRWRDLQGQHPDEQILNAKINILEERLNSKKQTLLQKELILDQITNLSDKLRKDALDGRQSTLELSEKINNYQSINKDLTRKMKSIISELSMFQANAIKLNQEREQLEQLVESARLNFQKGLPPTPEMNIEYLKMVRDQKRYEQERMVREQQAIMDQKYPPFATKTHAEKRPDAYIPEDGIGISKPYGNMAPFNPTRPGANMRHIRKPRPIEIQI